MDLKSSGFSDYGNYLGYGNRTQVMIRNSWPNDFHL
jgi:hypothetical protein